MHKVTLLFLSTALIATGALAGGSIFGHKHKTVNTNGVYAIGVHICSKLECPDVRIIEGPCTGEHMSKHWGVCVCDEGYVTKGTICEKEKDIDTGVCKNGNVYLSYNEDPCAEKTPHKGDTNMECVKNSDCKSGEFCNLSSSEWNYFTKPDIGTCTPIGEINTHTYINGTNKTFWASPYSLQWWGAENWCKAQGKSLISYTTLQNLFECDKEEDWDYKCNWDKFTTSANWQGGKTLTDYYWTSESCDSCCAFKIEVMTFYEYAHTDSYHALCEDEPYTPPCPINPKTDCLSKALVDGECVCAPADDGTLCTSWTNNECGKGMYCVFNPTGCYDDDHNTGVCKPVGYIGGEKTAPMYWGSERVKYTMSNCNTGHCPDWWSAQSWCKAHNKTMVTLSDLHCTSNGCTDYYWYEIGETLYGRPTWTTDMHDPCGAFRVDLGIAGGDVSSFSRYTSNNVLCR